MMIFAGIIGAIFTICAAGFGLTARLVRRRLPLSESLALAWLLGTSIVSLSLWVFSFLIRGITLQLAVSALCVILGVLGFRRWQKSSSMEAGVSLSKGLETFFVSVFCLELVAVTYLSFQHTLGWDGLLIWELKARLAFLNGGAIPTAYFGDVTRAFSHPEYPLLLPLTETWFYLWMGDCHQFWIKLVFPLWYAAGMLILMLAASELSGRRWIGWIVALLFLFVPCTHSSPGGVQVGYADLPFAAIFLATVFYLLRFLETRSDDSLALFVALGATLPWMKREGIILWAAVMLCGAIVVWRKRNPLSALAVLLPGIVVMGAWKIFLATIHALPSRDFLSVNLSTLGANWSRVVMIWHELHLELAETSRWNIFWPLVALALLSVLARQRNRQSFILAVLLLLPLTAYCASYVLSAWPDYVGHIEASLPRLLIHLTPVGWLLVAFALAPTQRRN